jgi:hypothetical protein
MQQSSPLLHVDEQIKKALHLPQSIVVTNQTKRMPAAASKCIHKQDG